MKKKQNKKFWQAVAVMLGYVIGVGMFAVPYLMASSGVYSFLFFLVLLVPVQYTVHMIYASMILCTKEYHRMPGYAGFYLGNKLKWVLFVSKVFGNWGGLLAYIIITGTFLHTLFAPIFGGNEFMYATGIFALEALIVFLGISMIAKVELLMSFLLLSVVALISYKGFEHIDMNNFIAMGSASFFLPYGAMLMALDGNGALPIVANLVDRDPKLMRKVIQLSTVIVTVILVVFTFSIVGMSGANTSPDSLSGLTGHLNGIVFWSLLFGVICMITSFMGVSESIKETLNWDFGINKNLAWGLAVFIPFTLYVLGVKDLTDVTSFVGAVGGGLSAILVVLIYRKIRTKAIVCNAMKLRLNTPMQLFLIIIFSIGLFTTITSLFL